MSNGMTVVRILIGDVRKLERDLLFQDGLERVSRCRREKILRLHFRRDRNLSLGAALLLDRLLASYGLCEKDMAYSENEYGKPSLNGCPDIRFSLSHAGDYAVCAVCTAGTTAAAHAAPAIAGISVPASVASFIAGASALPDLGIDVEPVALPDMDVVRRCLSESELKLLLSLPETGRAEMFTRLWTLKESFLKAVGTGIVEPFPSFDFQPCGTPFPSGEGPEFSCGDIPVYSGSKCAGNFRFMEFGWTGYRGALCISCRPGTQLSAHLDTVDFEQYLHPSIT